jgi:hypothetical protein
METKRTYMDKAIFATLERINDQILQTSYEHAGTTDIPSSFFCAGLRRAREIVFEIFAETSDEQIEQFCSEKEEAIPCNESSPTS